MENDRPLLYIVLGSQGSGRRAVLADLIQGAFAPEEKPAVLLPAGECAVEIDNRLPVAGRWSLEGDAVRIELPVGSTHVFVVLNGRENPVDQLEALSVWLRTAACELARVLCVADCAMLEKNPEAIAWYDACIHFSDVVLLGRREGVANKWMSDFRRRYSDQRFPCLFEMVKEGRVKNPAMVLEPEARRISHVFDLDEWAGIDLAGVEFGTDEKDEEGEGMTVEDLDPDDAPKVDPYFERKPGGYRVINLPQISRFIG